MYTDAQRRTCCCPRSTVSSFFLLSVLTSRDRDKEVRTQVCIPVDTQSPQNGIWVEGQREKEEDSVVKGQKGGIKFVCVLLGGR